MAVVAVQLCRAAALGRRICCDISGTRPSDYYHHHCWLGRDPYALWSTQPWSPSPDAARRA